MHISELALRMESSALVVPVTVLGWWSRAVNISKSDKGSSVMAVILEPLKSGEVRDFSWLSLCFSCQLVVTICQSR